MLHSVLKADGDDVTRKPLAAGGPSMREAGRALNITARTVAFHTYQMMAQLNLRSNAALIRYAVEQGIV